MSLVIAFLGSVFDMKITIYINEIESLSNMISSIQNFSTPRPAKLLEKRK